ncbi:MAG: Dabb family protein [Gemmobacter sp.]
MFYHIVMMTFTPEADGAFFGRVEHYARRVRAECADVATYAMTGNVASRGDGLTHALVGVFRSSQAHDDYQISPAHVEMKAFMSPFIDRIVVLDGEVPA